LSAERLHENGSAFLDALSSDESSRPDLGALASSLGFTLTDPMLAFVAAWPDEAVVSMANIVRLAIEHGRGLQVGWARTEGPVQVVAPDSWVVGDQPVPVIICGPHP
jgi:hypothetical protein